jgi:uncharacterized protein (TIGR03067 family)
MRSHVYAALAGCCAVFVGEVRAHAADPDLAALQGKWMVESFAYNNSPVDLMKDAVRDFSGEKYTLTPKTGDAFNGSVKIDSTKKPKQIDLEVNGRTLKGVYEIDGDTLKLCYTLNGDERPGELESKPDSGRVLVIHRRIK